MGFSPLQWHWFDFLWLFFYIIVVKMIIFGDKDSPGMKLVGVVTCSLLLLVAMSLTHGFIGFIRNNIARQERERKEYIDRVIKEQTRPKYSAGTLSWNSKIYDDGTVLLSGRESQGIRLGTLLPGQKITVSYLKGRIVFDNHTGESDPIWGSNNYGNTYSQKYPLKQHKVLAHAVYIATASSEHGAAFDEDMAPISLENKSQDEQDVWLRFHDAQGFFSDNEGDAKFRFTIK